MPDSQGLIAGGTVYELLANQWIPSREHSRTKRIREPVTGETALMLRQQTVLSSKTRPEMDVKLPTRKSRPIMPKSILQKRIPVES